MQYDSGDNFRVSRVAPSGQLEWEAQHDGVFSLDDVMTTMQVQAAGAVYAAGTSKLPGGGLEWNTVKFDSQGSVAWNERFGSETKTDFRPAALRVDELNYLWVAGSAPGTSGSGTDLLLLKYSTARPALIPMGAHQFSVEFNSRPGSTNRIRESGDLITWHDLATRVADATGRVRYEVDRNGLTNRVFFRCDLE
jgi:hypothetical protein